MKEKVCVSKSLNTKIDGGFVVVEGLPEHVHVWFKPLMKVGLDTSQHAESIAEKSSLSEGTRRLTVDTPANLTFLVQVKQMRSTFMSREQEVILVQVSDQRYYSQLGDSMWKWDR